MNMDMNMKWNDYPYDALYLWNGETIFRILEGDGSNLWPEDEEAGYKDYWITEYYRKDYGNGGMWLETELITDIDYTIQGVLDRMMTCDLWEDDWEILDTEKGRELFYELEK